MFTGDAAGVAARLATRLIMGCLACAAGVTNYTGVLWPVLALLMAWFGGFLALSRLARALIR